MPAPGRVIARDPVPQHFSNLKQEQTNHFYGSGDFWCLNKMNLIAVQGLLGTSRNVLIKNEREGGTTATMVGLVMELKPWVSDLDAKKINAALNSSLIHRNLISAFVYTIGGKKNEKRMQKTQHSVKNMTCKTSMPQRFIHRFVSLCILSDTPRSILPGKRNTAIKARYTP